VPLLIMAVAFKIYYVWSLFLRIRVEIIERERNTQWVKALVESK